MSIDTILRLSSGTNEEWEATTFPIPDGMVCYEIDTGYGKVGNGDDMYSDLDYAFDAIPEALRVLIDTSIIVTADENNRIPVSFFPKDVFNIHTVVENIAARDALDIEILKNSAMIFVVDASADPTVEAGMAFYAAKFSDETTYEWVKVGEQESIDLDLSNYLKIDEATLDDFADTDDWVRFTQSDLDELHTKINEGDHIIAQNEEYDYWVSPYEQYLISHIKGYDTEGIVDETGSALVTSNVSISNAEAHIHNGKSALFFPSSSAYIRLPLQLLSQIGTGDYTIGMWTKLLTASATGNIIQNTYSNASNRCLHFLYGSSGVFYARLGINTGNYETDFRRAEANVYTYYSLTRRNGVGYIHVNGVLKRTFTHTTNYGGTYTQPLTIGYTNSSFIGQTMAMQDFKIYSGIALYDDANYVPPMPT